jgi:hypothetical protein
MRRARPGFRLLTAVSIAALLLGDSSFDAPYASAVITQVVPTSTPQPINMPAEPALSSTLKATPVVAALAPTLTTTEEEVLQDAIALVEEQEPSELEQGNPSEPGERVTPPAQIRSRCRLVRVV